MDRIDRMGWDGMNLIVFLFILFILSIPVNCLSLLRNKASKQIEARAPGTQH